VVGAPSWIVRDMVDYYLPSALPDLVANRRFEVQLVAGAETKLNLVDYLSRDPPLIRDPRNRGKSHSGYAAHFHQDGSQFIQIAICCYGSCQFVFHLPSIVRSAVPVKPS
jgi:hypothetical protein